MKKSAQVLGVCGLAAVLGLTAYLSTLKPAETTELNDDRAAASECVEDSEPIPTTPAAPTKFVDVADSAGLNYVWRLPGSTPRNILQSIGNGCAFLDYDGDGNLDILLVGFQTALYRGDGHGHFVDVSAAIGLANVKGYYLGCAVGDYNNDGFPDIFLTGYHTAALLENEHGSQYVDVTAKSGIGTSTWSTSAAWGDVDGDGLIDLYVCNYCQFTPDSKQLCHIAGYDTSCTPRSYQPEFGQLYRNSGNGVFVDVTRQWGADKVTGKDLGAAFGDFDGSGRQSLFVANDEMRSNLFQNTGAAFQDIGRSSGTSVDEEGKAYSGMGVDWGDFDNDQKLDLAVMDYWNQDKRILRNLGSAVFQNGYRPLGFMVGGCPRVAFGVKWFDYDNDGWLDLMYSNGYTSDNVSQVVPPFTLEEPTLLYHNEVGGRFSNVTAGLGEAARPIVGRGLAVGDYDNDGKVDALVVDSAGKPLLLHNESPAGHWLQLRLRGTHSNHDGYGARVEAQVGAFKLLRVCHSDGSYMSSSDPRVHLGLNNQTVASLVITWPSGVRDTLAKVKADQIISVTEGQTHAGHK